MRILRISWERIRKYSILSIASIFLLWFLIPSSPNNGNRSGSLWDTFFYFDENKDVAKSAAFDIIQKELQGDWRKADLEDFNISKLSGGFTNLGFKCSAKNIQPVVLKIEFPKPKGERQREMNVMAAMSTLQGPKLLGAFAGGRIEEFIDSRIITEKELEDPKFAFELGKKVADMHHIPYAGANKNEYVDVMRGFLERIIEKEGREFSIKPTLDIQNHPLVVSVGMLADEIDQLEKYMDRKFSRTINLIHNDIFAPNILIQKEIEKKTGKAEEAIMLIDYEFSMQGHRGADFVGYFTDFEKNPTRRITASPDENHYEFCKGYLTRIYEMFHSLDALNERGLTGDMEIDIDTLLREAQDHMVFNHMFWGLENLVCHLEGNSQMDYENAFMNRIAAYYAVKEFEP